MVDLSVSSITQLGVDRQQFTEPHAHATLPMMVMLAYVTLVVSLVLEVALILSLTRTNINFKRYAALFIDTLFKVAAIVLIADTLSVFTVSLAVITVFRTINLARIMKHRMHERELRMRTLRTAVVLAVLTLISALSLGLELDQSSWALMVAYTQVAVATLLTLSVYATRGFYRYRPMQKKPKDVPTITVCIPARNETKDLPECIESVLQSTYPKLEIIVLDDCSHDKTPEIIKTYAKDGVRFIKGKVPTDDWLAKNSAYARLATEAKGEVLLFAGVDTRMEPQTITELVNQMGDSDMLSVLPKRSKESEASFFIQPIRYWWELGLWRFNLFSPPVISTCWLIRADALEKRGGFAGIKKAIEPEAVLARAFMAEKRYSFLVANTQVGLTSNKNAQAQYQTGLRMRYAQLRRRPESVLAVFVFELLCVLGPFITLLYALVESDAVLLALSIVSAVLLSIANAEVYKLALKRLWPLGIISFPALVVADWILLARSLYAYEFGKVVWKDRNICIPLLKVEKSLPKV